MRCAHYAIGSRQISELAVLAGSGDPLKAESPANSRTNRVPALFKHITEDSLCALCGTGHAAPTNCRGASSSGSQQLLSMVWIRRAAAPGKRGAGGSGLGPKSTRTTL